MGATSLFRLPAQRQKKKESQLARQIKRLGRYGGPLDFKVERFTCGGCLHFLLMVVGFAHRPFRSQTEWFTRFSRGNIWWRIWRIFHPQEKTSTGNGKKWNARGRIYRRIRWFLHYEEIGYEQRISSGKIPKIHGGRANEIPRLLSKLLLSHPISIPNVWCSSYHVRIICTSSPQRWRMLLKQSSVHFSPKKSLSTTITYSKRKKKTSSKILLLLKRRTKI